MTIIEAIDQIDELEPNMYKLGQKIGWLSRVDALITREILDKHEPDPDTELVPFEGYTEDTDQNTILIAPVPYDELYIYYLEMQINYNNKEYDKYNNSALMFQNAFDSFRNFWNRTHMPKTAHNKYY